MVATKGKPLEVLHPTAQLGEPNKCIICDETPHPWETRVIDTGQTMVAPFSDNVWRKYVCEKCGLEIGNRLGLVSNEQAKAAYHSAEAAASRLNEVRNRILEAAGDIHEFASDVSLGTERARVGKTVEGDFVEKPEKPIRSQKKAVGAGSSTPSSVRTTSS